MRLPGVEFPANRRLAYVRLVHDDQDIRGFLEHDVIIDGVSYFCVNVRTFTPGPYRKGDSIGILVEST